MSVSRENLVAACCAFALFACGCGSAPAAAAVEPDETTETWTSGDDDAIGAGEEDTQASEAATDQ